ncbi:hypothetical protein Taro_033947 [Colocasia esculenta]|uniref:Uncharacterized protein n=1 Tax=Colocasia esculenta TaxID=4460 RepID=A0A843VQ27_COLES|nr:hypothetical protein [Colocasia esculenta]
MIFLYLLLACVNKWNGMLTTSVGCSFAESYIHPKKLGAGSLHFNEHRQAAKEKLTSQKAFRVRNLIIKEIPDLDGREPRNDATGPLFLREVV